MLASAVVCLLITVMPIGEKRACRYRDHRHHHNIQSNNIIIVINVTVIIVVVIAIIIMFDNSRFHPLDIPGPPRQNGHFHDRLRLLDARGRDVPHKHPVSCLIVVATMSCINNNVMSFLATRARKQLC